MTQKFPAEAYRRYYLWAGATPEEAADFAANPGSQTAEWMPKDKDGSPYTAASFRAVMDGFFAHADNNIWSFPTTDRLTDTLSDGVFDAEASAQTEFILGLTGKRGVGKSFLTTELDNLGFRRLHPFNPGKAFLRGLYVSIGASEEDAWEMTDNSLKDVDLPLLQIGGQDGRSRWIMERLGWYMANIVGLDSTMGCELKHWAKKGDRYLLVDSVAYEADLIRSMEKPGTGVAIFGIEVPEGKRKTPAIEATNTDAAVAQLVTDGTIINNMDGINGLMNSLRDTIRQADKEIPDVLQPRIKAYVVDPSTPNEFIKEVQIKEGLRPLYDAMSSEKAPVGNVDIFWEDDLGNSWYYDGECASLDYDQTDGYTLIGNGTVPNRVVIVGYDHRTGDDVSVRGTIPEIMSDIRAIYSATDGKIYIPKEGEFTDVNPHLIFPDDPEEEMKNVAREHGQSKGIEP